MAGDPTESHPDAVGEPDHGHVCVTCPCNGAAHGGAVGATAVRAHKAAHLTHHDEEHHWPRYLPAYHHLLPTLLWYVNRLPRPCVGLLMYAYYTLL